MEKRTPYRLRRLNLDKSVRGVKVIFSALIDHADIAIGCCCIIWDDAVNLVQLEGCRVTAVVYAYSERRARFAFFHGYSSKYLFRLNSFFPIPCASYQ
jgi:hypothetical protein